VVEGAQLGGDGLGELVDQVLAPGRAQSHDLREDRRLAEPGHAVQRLRAGAERGDAEALDGRCGDAEALDGRCVLVQRRDPLVEREPAGQVVEEGEPTRKIPKQAGCGPSKRFDGLTAAAGCQ
jgi:hypothetical protein